jgi:hypothetical protein
MKAFCFILVLLLTSAAAYAEVNVYLYPRVDRGKNSLILSDLGTIEGDDEAAKVGSIGVDDALYADGYVDCRELNALIKAHVTGRVNIYGSGVRVNSAGPEAFREEPRIVVRKGSLVRFQVVSSRVRVEQTGTAMQDGAVGEEIPVRLKGTAVSRGRILNERVVELAL